MTAAQQTLLTMRTEQEGPHRTLGQVWMTRSLGEGTEEEEKGGGPESREEFTRGVPQEVSPSISRNPGG